MSKKETDFHSPYKLHIHVISAENLPIADLTTSDPYVTIMLSEKLEGRTKTVYRNRNPNWDEKFNLKLLNRRAVLVLKVFDEDSGKDDDLMGNIYIDLSQLSLDQMVQKKYSIVAAGTFDTTGAKVEVAILIQPNEAVIKVVPDAVVAVKSEEHIADTIKEIVEECPDVTAPEGVVNALTGFITDDKIPFFPNDLMRDLLWDASSLTRSTEESVELLKNNNKLIFNRTEVKFLNASKILLSNKACFWHPPIPKHSIQINLCANDSKFIWIEYPNRLSMWVGCRWLLLLYDFWKGRIKPAELPSWATNSSPSYACQCTVHTSDGKSFTGRATMSYERSFEIRLGDEGGVSLKTMHNLVMSADSNRPKSAIMDVEVLSFTATGEYANEDHSLMSGGGGGGLNGGGSSHGNNGGGGGGGAHDKKSMFQTVRQNIRGAVKGVAVGAVHVVAGAADAAVNTTYGVASNVAIGTVGAARSIAAGNPLNIIYTAQDNLFAVGKDLRSTLMDATQILGEASSFMCAKYDNGSTKIKTAAGGATGAAAGAPKSHFYVDCDENSFTTTDQSTLKRKSITGSEKAGGVSDSASSSKDTGLSELHRQASQTQMTEEYVANVYSEKPSDNVSMFLLHGNDNTHIVVGHKRLTAAELIKKADTNREVSLNTHLGKNYTIFFLLPFLSGFLTIFG
jgi:hypothetical protein